ncbi:kinetochore protein NDC80 homolog [Tubulanus polymorphus]|uniref:kinetochore protein NDC80 homolog n=1 Tax=Tubulanus polymorphus TaxID=672921 RepID=UPI003DA49B3A
MYGRSKSDAMKDPRHLSDRSFKELSIRRFIEFMLKIVDAKFRLDSKHEEQIPRLLKDLGYPFLISKNMLFTVRAPHVWPHLLGALSWLGDYIEAFKDGKGEFVEEDELYRKKQECLHDDKPMNFKSLQIERVRLKQDSNNLENEPDNLEYLTATRNKYQVELKQLTDQTEELNRRQFEKDKEFQMEIVRAMQEKDEMQKIYDTQDLSQDEIKRINMSRNEFMWWKLLILRRENGIWK